MTASFDYFGESFSYAEDFPAFEYAEFQEALADDVEANDGRATGVALRLAIACVAPSDQGRFRKLSRQHRAKVEDWLKVFRDWTSEAAERPTGEPTGSSTGPTSTGESSASVPVASDTSPQAPIPGSMALALVRSIPA